MQNPSCLLNSRHGTGRIIVVARQKDDPMAPLLDNRIVITECNHTQVIKTFHELSATVKDFTVKAEDGRPPSSSGRTPNAFVASMTVFAHSPARRSLRLLAVRPETGLPG